MRTKNSTLLSKLPQLSSDGLPTPSLLAGWLSQVSSAPLSPGVYWFLDANHNVLYVGKAKSLKKRLTNYTNPHRLIPRIRQMTQIAREVKYQVLESELEALLVEAELIRTHQPHYNVLLKDDKTPLYIQITDDLYPRVITLRKKEVITGTYRGTTLGPFPSAYKAKEVLKLARHIFPWCGLAGSHPASDLNRPCFYHHLDLCPGACVGKISHEEYQKNIRQLILFLQGKKKLLLKNIEQKMKSAAAQEQFESAARFRDQLHLITTVTQPTFRLKPNTVLPQLRATKEEEGVVQLANLVSTYLHLPRATTLHRIEGYDVSNTQGTQASVSMVTFTDGQADPAEYRLFNIRLLNTPNDYAMLREAITRRQNHPEWGGPDLVVIDGGKGQLRSALAVWNWATPMISIAKDPDRLIFPSQVAQAPGKRAKITYQILELPPDHPALQLVQRIRDEAHRFSKKQHTRRRLKNMFQ